MRIPSGETNCVAYDKRPPGFRIFERFVDAAEQREIEHWIVSNFAWEKRRQGSLPPAEQYPHDGPMPAWATVLGARMVTMGVVPFPPDHVLLRRYDRGVGVEPHIDRASYGPAVAGLTLGSSRMFYLTRRRSQFEALLLPGELYVMTGAARYRWKHSIPARLEDEFRGRTFVRTGGFSVTWRYLPGTRAQEEWWGRWIGPLGISKLWSCRRGE